MKKKILPIIICALGYNFAIANDTKAITGPVFGLQAGYAAGNGTTQNQTIYGAGGASEGSNINTNGNFNFGGFIGYDYAITDYLSIGPEIGINYTPNIYRDSIDIVGGSGSSVKYSALNVPIMLTGKIVTPIGLNMFLKGGINFQNLRAKATCTEPSPCASNQSQNKWTGVLATGLGYQISGFNVFAQYMYIFGDDISSLYGAVPNQYSNVMPGKALSQSIITGGVSYTFS